MLSPSLMASRCAAAEASSKPRRIRPARRAWRLDGLEFSRVELIETWQNLQDRAALTGVDLGVHYHDGHGCTTNPKHGKRDGVKVRTLRELLKVARADYRPRTGSGA